MCRKWSGVIRVSALKLLFNKAIVTSTAVRKGQSNTLNNIWESL